MQNESKFDKKFDTNRETKAAVWLVKSSDRILGPFSTAEMEERLRSKEIVILDEVVTPRSRWRLLRDEPTFSKLVEEIRRGQLSAREDTEAQGHTVSVTQNDNNQDLFDSDLTPVPEGFSPAIAPKSEDGASTTKQSVPLRNDPVIHTSGDAHELTQSRELDAAMENSRVTDAEFTDSDEDRPRSFAKIGASAGNARTESAKSDVRRYGVSNVAESKRSRSILTSLLWFGAVIAVGIALFLWLGPHVDEPSSADRAKVDAEHILSDAGIAWNQGEFATALKLYRQLDQLRPLKPEVVARLAPLVIQLEGATVSAKRMLTETLKVLPKDVGPAVQADLQNDLGLAALVGDDLPEAETRYRAAQTLASGSVPALFGVAMSAYLGRQYAEAARIFLTIPEESAYLLMGARSLAMVDKWNRVSGRKAAEVTINQLLERSQDFKQEAYLIGAGLDLEGGGKKAAAVKIRAAIDLDPNLTEDHRHDPVLDLRSLTWRELLPICKKVADELKSPVSRAFLGLCLFKAGNREEASQVVSNALAETPEESFLQSVDAYILAESGRLEDARASLRLASRAPVPKLAQLVQARVCSHGGDLGCAEKLWQSLALSDQPPLAAFTALAEIHLNRGDVPGAIQFAEKARQMSPTYRPLLLLQSKLHTDGASTADRSK